MDVSRTRMLALRSLAFIIDKALIISLVALLYEQTRHVLAIVLPVLLYFPLCEWLLRGFTPGKWICRIRVIAPNGEPPQLMQVLVRSAFRLVETNPFILGSLPAAIAVIWSCNARRLGDIWAYTFVIPTRDLAALRQRMAEMEEPTTTTATE
ncbi:RDD family protein [Pseudomonas sp. TUM22785]|uniref:RDD family protein n=1 Tax=Pseudomonas sp. TUM22785 TaxID=3019098 RepID=UPI002306C538|nr:RDD family protein [Pseudomonas sp. TUM22785]WCD81186.1 RDD family protein [Pseudomonas sp. TUM22785]